MSKAFTVSVPDQLWVDSWTENKTESYTYTGPDALHVIVNTQTDEVHNWSEDPLTASEDNAEIVVTIDATVDDNVPVAHFLYSVGAEHTYTYEDETNHDGSIYQKITNPTIHDYFDLAYDADNGINLTPLYKNPKTIAEEKAENRKAYVEKYNNVYDFEADTQATIDTFLTAIDDYLAGMVGAYPWKYVVIDENNIPKIPASLVSTFSTLPEIE